jgi:protein PET100, fungi type
MVVTGKNAEVVRSPEVLSSAEFFPRWSMAGPNLEVFKFAVYVFFPVLVFLHYGDPEWYRKNVIPVRTSFPLTSLVSYDRRDSTKNEFSLVRRG